jgi:hypothetical protein
VACPDKLTENSAVIASINEALEEFLPNTNFLKAYIDPIHYRDGTDESGLKHYYTLCQMSSTITHGVTVKRILYSGPDLDLLKHMIKIHLTMILNKPDEAQPEADEIPAKIFFQPDESRKDTDA